MTRAFSALAVVAFCVAITGSELQGESTSRFLATGVHSGGHPSTDGGAGGSVTADAAGSHAGAPASPAPEHSAADDAVGTPPAQAAPPADGHDPGTPVGPGTAGLVVGETGLAGGRIGSGDGPAPSTASEQFGAFGDGVHDDTAALQETLDNVPEGGTLRLRPGATYLHSDVLRLTTPGVTVIGNGATLTATDELRSAFHVDADAVTVSGLTLTLAGSTQRFHAYEQMKVRISGNGVVLRDVRVRGAAAAGVYVGNGSSNFLLDRVTVEGSRADGIHITGGAHDGRVVSPVTKNTGDDGVAVVSYQADGTPVERIRITSPTVDGTTWGRGISVVGGNDVVYSDVTIRNTDAAGVYIGSEGNPYYTFPSVGVLVDGGTVTGANTNPAKDHGAVIVYAGNAGTESRDLTVRGLAISDTRAGATWDVGVIADSGALVQQVTLANLAIRQGARNAFYSNTEPTVRLLDVSDDGQPLADRLGW